MQTHIYVVRSPPNHCSGSQCRNRSSKPPCSRCTSALQAGASFTKIAFLSKFLLRGFIKLLGRRILNVNVLPIPFIITVHWHIASR